MDNNQLIKFQKLVREKLKTRPKMAQHGNQPSKLKMDISKFKLTDKTKLKLKTVNSNFRINPFSVRDVMQRLTKKH